MKTEDITFEQFDQLKLEQFANRLTDYLNIERQFLPGGYIVSLNGGFGSGKSTFFQMWFNKLKAAEEKIFEPMILNSWDADFLRDPLLSLISSFVSHLEKANTEDKGQLKELAGRISRFSFSALNDLTKGLTKVDLEKAVGRADEDDQITGRACFEIFEQRKNAFTELKKLLGTMANESQLPLLVMVDELDRCRPNYAVEYLEVIKHVFDLNNVVFVLGVDRASLESSVRCLFGNSINFDEYFRKFAQRNFDLPKPSEWATLNLANHLRSEFLNVGNLQRDNTNPVGGGHSILEKSFIEAINPTPRQLIEFIRIRTHVVQRMVKQQVRGNFHNYDAAVVMSLLSVTHPELYRRLGSKNCEVSDLLECLELLRGIHRFWEYAVSEPDLRFLVFWTIGGSIQDFKNVGEQIEKRQLSKTTGEYAFTGAVFLKNAKNHSRNGLDEQRRRYPTEFHAARNVIEEVDDF